MFFVLTCFEWIISFYYYFIYIYFFFSAYIIFRSVGDEDFGREIFEEYITSLHERAKEKERKREEEKVWLLLSVISCGYHYTSLVAKTLSHMAF